MVGAAFALVVAVGGFGGVAGPVDGVDEVTVRFGSQSGCRTQRAGVSGARAGDAALVESWKLEDGSFVHAAVTRAGTVEVERCACGEVGAAAVRVRVVRARPAGVAAGAGEGRAPAFPEPLPWARLVAWRSGGNE